MKKPPAPDCTHDPVWVLRRLRMVSAFALLGCVTAGVIFGGSDRVHEIGALIGALVGLLYAPSLARADLQSSQTSSYKESK